MNVKAQETSNDAAGVLSVKERICVPRARLDLKSHGFRYSIHPGLTKMYRDFKRVY